MYRDHHLHPQGIASSRRSASIYSDGSVASDTRSLRSIPSERPRHRRTISDTSAISVSVRSYTGSDILGESNPLPTVFVSPPPRNLLCMLCDGVFTEPVIAQCGHTFCKACLARAGPDDVCLIDHTPLSRTSTIPNKNLEEQLQELEVYCPNGIKQVQDGEAMRYVPDPEGCQAILRMGEQKQHEEVCGFAKIVCPNSSRCGPVLRKDLDRHLEQCQHHKCPYHYQGCMFTGSKADVRHHSADCPYARRPSPRAAHHRDSISSGGGSVGGGSNLAPIVRHLQQALHAKDTEVEELKTTVLGLTERLATLERLFQEHQAATEMAVERLAADVIDTQRAVTDNTRDLSAIQAKLGIVEESGLINQSHKYKCQGTFVGHQGPVWALAAHGDMIFSGSSDETIKVWDTAANFSCKRTLSEHRGTIHCLLVHGHKLFSGSSDKTVKVWNIDTFELLDDIGEHEQPVCTLAVAGDVLLTGSLKVIKVWDIHTHEFLGQISDLNHWVRAMVVVDGFVYAGSYQTVSVWPATRKGLGLEKEPARRVQVLHSPEGGSVYSLAVSPDYIIAGTFENLIHVWNKDYEKVDSLQGHIGTVYGLTVLRDGQNKGRLFSAAYDRTVKVWSLDTFQCLQTLARHTHSVDCIVIHKGRIFTGAADSTVKVWQ